MNRHGAFQLTLVCEQMAHTVTTHAERKPGVQARCSTFWKRCGACRQMVPRVPDETFIDV